jgi:prolyl-tRNA synthetase
LKYANEIAKELSEVSYNGNCLSVHIDKRDKRGGEKNWEWIKKGVPLRIEIGPRDLEKQMMMVSRRDKSHKEKLQVTPTAFKEQVALILDEIQNNYYNQAKKMTLVLFLQNGAEMSKQKKC